LVVIGFSFHLRFLLRTSIRAIHPASIVHDERGRWISTSTVGFYACHRARGGRSREEPWALQRAWCTWSTRARDPQKVQGFLMRYEDRILCCTDVSYGPDDTDPAEVAAVHAGWLADWRLLVTADCMHSYDFDGVLRGMHLSRTVRSTGAMPRDCLAGPGTRKQ
jgi:hypothetical protein